ncbi:hypothetical protein JOM56_014571 [Amanita muscaria]
MEQQSLQRAQQKTDRVIGSDRLSTFDDRPSLPYVIIYIRLWAKASTKLVLSAKPLNRRFTICLWIRAKELHLPLVVRSNGHYDLLPVWLCRADGGSQDISLVQYLQCEIWSGAGGGWH